MYLVALLVFAAWSFYPALRVQYCEQREKGRLEDELARLKERNSNLREQVDRLKTPEGVEDLARRDLGFVEPGENAYVVRGSDEPTRVTDRASAEETSSLATRVLDYVFAVP